VNGFVEHHDRSLPALPIVALLTGLVEAIRRLANPDDLSAASTHDMARVEADNRLLGLPDIAHAASRASAVRRST
jgi:hypothetical protein